MGSGSARWLRSSAGAAGNAGNVARQLPSSFPMIEVSGKVSFRYGGASSFPRTVLVSAGKLTSAFGGRGGGGASGVVFDFVIFRFLFVRG